MGLDWKMFAADFLTEVTEDIEERQTEAKTYEKEQKAAAERNAQLIQQRDLKARSAASLGKQARALGASPAQVRTAMASGITGIADLYSKLQAAANTKGIKTLGVDDVDALINMPNLATVNQELIDMPLEEFAKRSYGVQPLTTTTKPDTKEASMLASMFGYDAKQRAEKRLSDTEFAGGMSVADINALSRQSEYSSLIDDATMTFTEVNYFTSDNSLTFSKTLSKTLSDSVKGDEAEAYIKGKVRAAGNSSMTTSELKEARDKAAKNARDFLKTNAAKILIDQYADTYHKGGFFDSRLVRNQIEAAMGTGYLNELLDMYDQVPNTQEDSDQDSSTTSSSTTSPEVNLKTPIKVEQTLREPEATGSEAEEDSTLKAASPLTEEGKAIVEQALGGQLIKGYTAEYTREQWNNMSRNEREERDLPVSRAGIIGFDFKEDIDEMLEKPLRNLNIKRNLNPNKEYKIKIKGGSRKGGTYTVTGNQLSTMDDGAFTMPYKPAIEITEYKEGDNKAPKITQRILKRYQRDFKEKVQEEKDALGPTNPNM